MICPSCKCEYAQVQHNARTAAYRLSIHSIQRLRPPGTLRVVSVWAVMIRQNAPAVKEALEKGEIPFVDQSSNAYFNLRSMLAKMEICVPSADEERARKILAGFLGTSTSTELTPEKLHRSRYLNRTTILMTKITTIQVGLLRIGILMN